MAIIGVKTKLTDTDNGAKALFLRMLGASDVSMSVGIHADAGAREYKRPVRAKKREEAAPDGKKKKKAPKDKKTPKNVPITLVELGEIHEFGLGVPQRSWLGDWFDDGQSRMLQQLHGVAHAVLTEKIDSFEQGLEQLGNLYVGQIQARIAQGIEPPLSPFTIAEKGSSVPLIDTGQFRGAITYKVDSKNGVKEGGGDTGGEATE